MRKSMKGPAFISSFLICPGMHCALPRMIRLNFVRSMAFFLGGAHCSADRGLGFFDGVAFGLFQIRAVRGAELS